MQEINKLGFFKQKNKLFTNTKFDEKYFDERIIKVDNKLYKEIDPKRSKLAAAIMKGLSQTGIKQDSTILYLGASHGYTVSFLSDVVFSGAVFALDFSPVVMRDMVLIAEKRENIIPLLEDAKKPEDYKQKIVPVDVVFQDVAQKDQVKIFLDNCNLHLKEGGFGLLALKARSVDITKKPKEVFKNARIQIEKEYAIVDYRELDPFEKDHAFFVVKKK